MSWFDTLFSGGTGAAANSMRGGYQQSIGDYQNALSKIKDLLSPYMQQGMEANKDIMGMGDTLRNSFQRGFGTNGDWMSNYQQSPYAKYLTQQGTNAAQAAAASSGLIGSGANLRNLTDMSQNIASQDMQRYHDNLMNEEQAAMGAYSPISQQGYGATGNLANYTYGTGQNIANAHQNMGMANAYGDMGRAGGYNNIMQLLAMLGLGG